jgi:hypothetical protein
MATKRKSSQSKGKTKIHKVMKEHKSGTLKSGSGKKVKSGRDCAQRGARVRRENPQEEKLLG